MKIKQPLLAALLLVGLLGGASAVRAAGGYDMVWSLADEFGTPAEYDLGTPISGIHFLSYNGSTHRPEIRDIGAGLQLDGNAIGIGGIVIDAVTDLHETLDALEADKSNVGHTHSTSDITGLQSFVDGRIASTSQNLSFATSTRSLNSAFQVSSTKAAFVTYTVDVATSLSLTGGATGTITLQYADDSGFTTNVKTVQSSVNGNTGTLTIGLAVTQTSTASLTGIIPASKYVKIVTANTVGTPTFTYRTQQEVILPMQ